MKAESSSTDIKFITFSELMSEVKQGLRQYDENNLIDEKTLIKHVVRCNDFLGERLHQSRQCRIKVKNYKAPIPTDMWKIENLYGITEGVSRESIPFSGIFGGGMVFHEESEKDKIKERSERIEYLGILSNDCWNPVHVSAYDTNFFERTENKKTFALVLTPQASNKCVSYSACGSIQNGYQVDLQDDEFTFSFKEGEVFLSYLGDMVNEKGELLIPASELILPFYEWTLKKEILEDLFMNSEADVQNKYMLAKQNLVEAKLLAMDYVNAFKGGQLDHLSKKRKTQFYNDWMRKFE